MTPAITDVPGILIGHAENREALTGVTVALCPEGAVGGVDVRGGAPGTRETDLLNPVNMVQQVHAVALCGGSALGLAAAGGVAQWLHERGHGFDVGVTRVPIVPAAVIFDLAFGAPVWPDAALGYAACEVAGPAVAEGCVGVGLGATVGKALGPAQAMKGGVGSWSETLPDGTTVGALVVVNAFGDVWEEHGGIIAGARAAVGGFADTMRLLRDPAMLAALGGGRADEVRNTTLTIVATDARLTKAEATKLAQMAQDGLSRTIRPVHTPFDGDTVFALATGRRAGPPMLVLGSIAADVLSRAVERAAWAATGLGGMPGAGDRVG
ncbi:P1 family peptidase [Oscillochloris sp. ZM17-4]|uniref:P1 family peptidase n=1 Tax=Oscillochloris sp. ZM17-4 TaxID=2866714 RepID=UPI001C73CDC8|nr:P1 family peptidase [Oscillochloris sp. ZM17-4]MBX0326907.1 P1 family peptidase [Oscillochloris sp. ZM17-4]